MAANKMRSKLIEDWRCPNHGDSSLYDVAGGGSGYVGRRPSSSSKSSVGVRSSSPRRRTSWTADEHYQDDGGEVGTLLSLSTPVALVIIVAVCIAALLAAVGLVSYYVAIKV